jgi:murein DD-endopeptidase MepM/ murein hydrolase activator NlpD
LLPWVVAALGFALVIALGIGYLFYRGYTSKASATRMARLLTWFRNSEAHPDWAVSAGERCGEAPFLIPTNGYIGFIWGDSFRIGHRHQGLDIFGGEELNTTPVVAAYSGYLTRLPDWKSSLIVRIPEDPLNPGRQIWTYYTHMASSRGESYILSEFPPGTNELFIEEGTLLGYQGNYSGTPGNPTGVHLHFSIVLDDGNGRFLNELEISNTLDPSPYLGMSLNAGNNKDIVPTCDVRAIDAGF